MPRPLRVVGILAPAALVIGAGPGIVARLRYGGMSIVEAGGMAAVLVLWGFVAALDHATGGRWITTAGVGIALVLAPWGIWLGWSEGGTVSVAIGCALYLLALDGAWRAIGRWRAA